MLYVMYMLYVVCCIISDVRGSFNKICNTLPLIWCLNAHYIVTESLDHVLIRDGLSRPSYVLYICYVLCDMLCFMCFCYMFLLYVFVICFCYMFLIYVFVISCVVCNVMLCKSELVSINLQHFSIDLVCRGTLLLKSLMDGVLRPLVIGYGYDWGKGLLVMVMVIVMVHIFIYIYKLPLLKIVDFINFRVLNPHHLSSNLILLIYIYILNIYILTERPNISSIKRIDRILSDNIFVPFVCYTEPCMKIQIDFF